MLDNIEDRLSMLYLSYEQHVKPEIEVLPIDIKPYFEKIAEAPFHDVLVQYDGYDKTIDIWTAYDESIQVFINIDLEEMFDGVVFSIYHGKKLLVCDEMELNELIDKLIEVSEERRKEQDEE